MRNDIIQKKEQILIWITESQSKSYMCKQLQCKPETLDKYLKLLEIEYVGNRGLKGIKIGKHKTYDEVKKSLTIGSHRIKLKLIKEGIKEEKCEVCNLSEWNNTKIPLELHHIDGDRYNHELYNLQILCPNCHALTDNYSGKKLKKNKVITQIKKPPTNVIKKLHRKVDRPTYQQLKDEINDLGYSGVGRKYNVSDNSIRKWVKFYEKYPDDGIR